MQTKFKYSAILGEIKQFDANCRKKYPNPPESKITLGGVCFSVLDNSKKNLDLDEIIICVGSNYTQGTGNISIEENNSSLRRNLDRGLKDFSKKQSSWIKRLHAGEKIEALRANCLNDGYHLIITNFCPFITKQRWQNHSESERANLLLWDSNQFLHLKDLLDKFNAYNPIWIGHGIHCEVPYLFRQFILQNKISRWLLMPNLSYWYNYESWPHSNHSS